LRGALLNKFKSIIRRDLIGEGAVIVSKFGTVERLLPVRSSHFSTALRHGRAHVGAVDGGMALSASYVAHEIGTEDAGHGQQDKGESAPH
jgi:hypothetical protein